MTTWPSGLRRVTRNHFSSGGVGSNPAVVVFYCLVFSSFFLVYFLLFLFILIHLFFPYKKMVTPRFELGSREPESHMLPLHHGTFLSYLYSFPFTMPSYPWPLLFYPPMPFFLFLYSLYSLFFLLTLFFFLLTLSSFLSPFPSPPYLTSSLFSLLFLFSKKRLPWVSNPRPYG